MIILKSNEKAYIMEITSFANSDSHIYCSWQAQIKALELINIPTNILDKYKNFIYAILCNLVAQFLKHMEINNYIIKFIDYQ